MPHPDALYYSRLEIGAVYLAALTADPADRAEHARMATVYRERARDAAMTDGGAAR